MKTRRTQLTLTAGALAMAVALVGCGGGAGPKAAINGGVETQTYSATAAVNRAVQRAAISSAINAAQTAVRALTLSSTDADIAAAQALIDEIAVAIEAGVDVPAHEIADATAMQAGVQSDIAAREMAAMAYRDLGDANDEVDRLTGELATATGNVERLTGELATATGNVERLTGERDTARGEVTRLTGELATANSDKETLQGQLETEMGKVTSLTTQLETEMGKVTSLTTELETEKGKVASLTTERDKYKADLEEANKELARLRQEAMDRAEEEARKERVATAKKLYDGISTPTGTAGSPAAGDRIAAYGGTNDSQIIVSAGLPANSPASVPLSEDKKTEVADNAGWAGKRYADPSGGDSYEAIVYSNVEDPTAGDKFSTEYSGNFDFVNGVLDETTTEGTANRVASPSFDHTAGVKTFKLPDTNTVAVMISGMYHGVAGTYRCTPGANTCAVQVAASGFNLGGLTTANDPTTFGAGNAAWTFSPTDANALVMSAADTVYASYGWWLHKSADGEDFTASAFHDEKGSVGNATGLTALLGSATYMGGAAGKYALSNPSGEPNDAGHFTADATLEADFTNNTTETAITGTIDNFIGADGESRDWEVELKGSQISDGGGLGNASPSTGVQTVWTIGGEAADASGDWSGQLRNNGTGTNGVPQVATGTFYSEYGRIGRIVGAFGANVQ